MYNKFEKMGLGAAIQSITIPKMPTHALLSHALSLDQQVFKLLKMKKHPLDKRCFKLVKKLK